MEFEDLYEMIKEYQNTKNKKLLENILNFFGEFVYKVANESSNEKLPFEDIVQICFEEIIKLVTTYNFNTWSEDSFLPRLTDNISNALMDEMDKSNNFDNSYEEDFEFQEDTTLDDSLSNIRMNILDEFINNLSDTEMKIITYVYINNNKDDFELAKKLGLELRHVKDKKRIIKKKLYAKRLKRELISYLDEE